MRGKTRRAGGGRTVRALSECRVPPLAVLNLSLPIGVAGVGRPDDARVEWRPQRTGDTVRFFTWRWIVQHWPVHRTIVVPAIIGPYYAVQQ